MSLLTMSAQLAEGFLITVEIFVLTLLFSLPLGLIVAFGRMLDSFISIFPINGIVNNGMSPNVPDEIIGINLYNLANHISE